MKKEKKKGRKNGVASGNSPVLSFLSLQVIDSFEFYYVPHFRNRDFLHQKYVVEGLSRGEIAAQVFSCRTSITKYLKEFGIPLRLPSKTRNQLGYGEAWRGRQVVPHKKEQAFISKMKDLRDQGQSFREIAKTMNEWKVPTKTGRGKWHARTVHQILEKLK